MLNDFSAIVASCGRVDCLAGNGHLAAALGAVVRKVEGTVISRLKNAGRHGTVERPAVPIALDVWEKGDLLKVWKAGFAIRESRVPKVGIRAALLG